MLSMKDKQNLLLHNKTVSAIVPVFNEEKTVEGVVKTLLSSELISEVICVNDGSKDKSLEVLKSFGGKIKLINLKRNHGKGFALASGIRKARGEITAFFDSDLPNLSLEHVQTLLNPILKDGNIQAVLGVPTRNKSNFYRPWCVYLTGERAYPREKLLLHLKRMAKTRYGVEIYLNTLFGKKEVKVVPLEGLILPPKQAKRAPAQALKEYLIEAVEIAQEIGRKEILPSEDYQKIMGLAKAKTLKDLQAKFNEIKNKKVKELLGRYVLEHIALAQKKASSVISSKSAPGNILYVPRTPHVLFAVVLVLLAAAASASIGILILAPHLLKAFPL